jgi:hypothetical protein
MITREQYLEALDIVETYHQQLKKDTKTLTPILKWGEFNSCSRRLQNVLKWIEWGVSYKQSDLPYIEYKEEFIENIKIEKMRKIPHCGVKTVHEFIGLRGY